MTIRTGVLALLAAVLVPHGASAAGEAGRLVSPAPPGFVVGYQASDAAQSIREEVPRGETVEAWTRMITTQRFAGVQTQVTPAAFLARMTADVARSCPGARASVVAGSTRAGHAAAQMQVDCPSSTGGAPESFVILAIAGDDALYVKQAAVRGAGAPARLGWGSALLAATRLCAGAAAACR